MKIEKAKKIIFTMICILLISAIGVVSFAAWDDITGKKNEFSVSVADAAGITFTTADFGAKVLMPYGSVALAATSGKTDTNYLEASFTVTALTKKYEMHYQGINVFDLGNVSQLNANAVKADSTIQMKLTATKLPVVNFANLTAIQTLNVGKVFDPSVAPSTATQSKTFYIYVYFTLDLSSTTVADKEIYNVYKNLPITLDIQFQLVAKV